MTWLYTVEKGFTKTVPVVKGFKKRESRIKDVPKTFSDSKICPNFFRLKDMSKTDSESKICPKLISTQR